MGKRTAEPLTAFKVAAAGPGQYSDGGSSAALRLVVKPNKRRYWIVRGTLDGRRRDFVIGAADGKGATKNLSLADARTAAADLRKLLRSGIDPAAVEKEERRARAAARALATERTFKVVAERFLGVHLPTLKTDAQRAHWRATLADHVFPRLGECQIDAITGPMIIEALGTIWERQPETAKRIRQRVGAVLDYAHALDWRGPKPDLQALTAKALPRHTGQVRHHAALPYDAAAGFMATLRGLDSTAGRLALEFLILTAVRSGEVRLATWAEVDTAAATWTIPAERMKMKRVHVVPLSEAALDVLKRAARMREKAEPAAPIFPGREGGALSDMALSNALKAIRGDITVHGWRSTFRDWAGESTVFPADVCEAALAHAIGDTTRRAYQRGDLLEKRRELMAAWARYLAPSVENVTRLADHRRASNG